MVTATGALERRGRYLRVGLSGPPAWLLWRANYLAQMPALRRKARIWVEWTRGMFFAADITHLRVMRSAELQAEEGR